MNKKQCDISVKPHTVLSEIYEVRGNCEERIRTITANQGPYHRKMFLRRLVYIDDSTKPREQTSTE